MRFFIPLTTVCFALLCFNAPAATVRYVDASGTNPVVPYTSWATAATNIQDAINISSFSDTVLVTNGIYQYGGDSFGSSNRVDTINSVNVMSVNGPLVTIIKGHQIPGTTNGSSAVRCVYLREFSTLSGFTLTNGATQSSGGGGGVQMDSQCVVSNCIITGNAADDFGGGAYSANNSTLVNCVICGNTTVYGGSIGGGVRGCILNNCVVSNNFAVNGGGVYGCTVNNSLLVGNGSTNSTSGGAANSSTLNNCTIVGNFSFGLGAADNCNLTNSIIYYNNNGNYADCYQCRLANSCTTIGLGTASLPDNSISNAPLFVNLAAGNFHLQPFSPCVNTGNNLYQTNSTDLDGNARIVGGTVDMGAFENQNTNLVHFVRTNSFNAAPISPFTNWLTAATNIQDAIDVASAGDFIVVSNGIYNAGGRAVYTTVTNRVVVDKAVTVQSVNGPVVTIIAGLSSPRIRCAYLTNGAALNGFTLTNGNVSAQGDPTNTSSGGGVWCSDVSATVSNCVLTANFAQEYGGGAYGGTLNNCIITNNQAFISGGGTYNSVLKNCLVITNKLIQGSGGGGAAYGILSNCLIVQNFAPGSGGGTYFSTLNNCVVSNNAAGNFGGGVCFGIINSSLVSSNRASSGGGAYSNALVNCTLINNFAGGIGGGGGAYNSALANCTVVSNTASFAPAGVNGGGVFGGTLNNCLLANNLANGDGGGAYSGVLNNCVLRNNIAFSGGGAYNSTLLSCTVVSNSASLGGGSYNDHLKNCIVYYNHAGSTLPTDNYSGGDITNCCTMPFPTNGIGSITNEPAFVNFSAADLHLQSNSPCINAGNNSYVTNTTDFDGNPRIAAGTVDIGAYEFQSPSSLISYAWLQQYGLPADGSADNLDSDGDGMNDWQEWRAGTNPNDASSLLKMSSVAPTNDFSSTTITWQSVTNVNYFVQRGSDLSAQPIFSTIQSNIVGQAGMTSYTDTTATNSNSYFYRVGVQ